MPTYSFRNTETKEVFDKIMSFATREQYLSENPNIQYVVGSPRLITNNGAMKPDDGFRDVLREIRRKTDMRFSRSTVNTF